MPEHWRLGLVERSVLRALAQAEARPDRPHRKCALIVRRIDEDFGVSPRYAYDSLSTLAKAWLLHLPLVDFHGNNGSPDPDDRPANPRYTEARLSAAGAIALASEDGSGPKAPIALINGDLHVDGDAPPYSPSRVVATLLAAADEPRLTDAEIIDRIGAPVSPTGCEVACDHLALARGEDTEMVSSAQLTIETGRRGDRIVLTNPPLGIGSQTIAEALASRAGAAHRRPEFRTESEFGDLGLALRAVDDMSHGEVSRVVCEPQIGADLDELVQQIAATWGVRTRQPVQLPAPLALLVRELVDDDHAAQRAALATLLESAAT